MRVTQSVSQLALMSAAYRSVVADLTTRMEKLAAARDAVLAFYDVGADLPPMLTPTKVRTGKRIATLKAKLTGTSGTGALVLAALRGGADTLAGIAKDCKVTVSTARTALLALEDAGRVKRQGKSRATRYRLTNDK